MIHVSGALSGLQSRYLFHFWAVIPRYGVFANDEEDLYLRGNEMIMKTAWCSSVKTSESDIHLAIDQPHEGLAKFECGGDVWSTGYSITVQNVRGKVLHDLDIDPPTPVLHRLVLCTGCP